jgi:putative transposase
MPNYRRAHVPGGTFFFTLKTERNAPIFHDSSAVELLGSILRVANERWPVVTNAMVLLPDHLHALWSMPSGDDRYSLRWAWIKKEFTKQFLTNGGAEQPISDSKRRHRRRGVWQRKFWEHTIQDEDDFHAHFDYIHWNPVKHGYVRCPADWPHSTFQRWVAAGVYQPHWGCGDRMPPMFPLLMETGE